MIRECLFIGGPWDRQQRNIEVLEYWNVRERQDPVPRLHTPTNIYEHTAPNIVEYRRTRLALGTLDVYVYIAPSISDEKILNYILRILEVGVFGLNDS